MAIIDTFRSKIINGGARPSQFEVSLLFPAGIGDGASSKFLVIAASLPASNISTIDIMYRGRAVKIPGERTFGDWGVRVLNDGAFTIRSALERWSAMLINHSRTDGRLDFSENQLVKDMTVTQLDRNDNEIRTYNFKNCFPTKIESIQLDFSKANDIETYDVTFSVDYWLVAEETTLI